MWILRGRGLRGMLRVINATCDKSFLLEPHDQLVARHMPDDLFLNLTRHELTAQQTVTRQRAATGCLHCEHQLASGSTAVHHFALQPFQIRQLQDHIRNRVASSLYAPCRDVSSNAICRNHSHTFVQKPIIDSQMCTSPLLLNLLQRRDPDENALQRVVLVFPGESQVLQLTFDRSPLVFSSPLAL